jgi:hypothetical protein
VDGDRFDQLALLFGRARSRREALRLLAAGAAAGAASLRRPRPAAAAVCPQRVPKPGYVPTANGCGPDGYDWFVPDSWRKANFTAACSGHDVCYGTCNSQQAACDDAFLEGLKRACRAAYPPNGTRRQRTLYQDCRDRAYQYYAAVSDHGASAWEDAQAEACLCCSREGRGPKCGGECCEADEACRNGRCEPKEGCGDGPACGAGETCCRLKDGSAVCCAEGRCLEPGLCCAVGAVVRCSGQAAHCAPPDNVCCGEYSCPNCDQC